LKEYDPKLLARAEMITKTTKGGVYEGSYWAQLDKYVVYDILVRREAMYQSGVKNVSNLRASPKQTSIVHYMKGVK
jgi:tRNA splicing endonuclease